MENHSIGNTTLNHTEYSYILKLKSTAEILSIFALVFLVLAIGADVKIQEILEHLRTPISIVIGMICQFIAMPLFGFILICALQLTGPAALGVLLMSCSPGGSLSNFLTYAFRGDISLSVTMTTLSTLFAIACMPINFWLYGHWIDVGSLIIPYGYLIITVAYVWIPTMLGVFIKWKFPEYATYVIKIGFTLSLIITVICIILYKLVFPNFLSTVYWEFFVAGIVMPFTGFGFGFGLAFLCSRNIAICITIGVESGVQNLGIPLAFIAVAGFNFEEQKLITMFPMLYGIMTNIIGVVSVLIFYIYLRLKKYPIPPKEEKVSDSISTEKDETKEEKTVVETEKASVPSSSFSELKDDANETTSLK